MGIDRADESGFRRNCVGYWVINEKEEYAGITLLPFAGAARKGVNLERKTENGLFGTCGKNFGEKNGSCFL